jgi:hypothetical protein
VFLSERHLGFSTFRGDDQVLGRVYFDADSGASQVFLVSVPGEIEGEITATGATDLWGMELNNRFLTPFNAPPRFVTGVLGFRYLQLNDFLRIDEISSVVPGALNPGNRPDFLARSDQFSTYNRFFGPQVGAEAEWFFERLYCNLYGKVAIGTTLSSVSIQGATATSTSGELVQGGFLAQPTNIGDESRLQFGVLPEFGFNLGYQVSDRCRVTFGYSYLYWYSTARVGKQIDPTINFAQAGFPPALVQPARPAFVLHDTDFWVQGVNFSLELRY